MRRILTFAVVAAFSTAAVAQSGGMVVGGPLNGSILPGPNGGMVIGGPLNGTFLPGARGGMVIGGPLNGTFLPGGNTSPSLPISNTSPNYQDDPGRGFRELGQAIANIRENNFRKGLGKLLASGDCAGAARLALEKGRLEIGLAIRESCGTSPAQQGPAEVSRQLQSLAAQAKIPEPYGEGLTITAVQAAGMQLIITVQYGRAGPLPVERRRAAIRDVCSSEPMRPLLSAGAVVRAFYLAPDGSQLAKDEVTASACGLG